MRAAIGVLVWLAGCGAPSTAPRRPPKPAADKEALYGDPGLVPSREGERARRELATAGEIDGAVRILPGVDDVRVDVEHRPGLPDAIAVVVRLTGGSSSEAVREQVVTIVAGVAGDDAAGDAEIVVAVPTREEAPGRPELPVGLALALLGFGASVGVTADRLLRRRLRRRR